MEDIADRMQALSVSQMVIGNLLGVLQESNKHGRVITALDQLRQTGNDVAAAQLELVLHTVNSINGEEALLIEQDLPDWQVLRFNVAAPLLISMLVAPMDDADAARMRTLIAEWGRMGQERGGEEGAFYDHALQMILDATSLAQAAQQANRDFGL